MKRKGWILLAVAAVLVIGTYSWLKGSYNDMVLRREAATAQLGNVENQYQRRMDLIPNLVNTVKGYASHEQNTLSEVVEARAQATQTRIDVNDAAAMARFAQAQGELFLGTEPSDGHFGKLSRSEGQVRTSAICRRSWREPKTGLPSSAASITRLPSRSIPISKCSRAICSPACSVLLR